MRVKVGDRNFFVPSGLIEYRDRPLLMQTLIEEKCLSIKSTAPALAWLALAISVPLAAQSSQAPTTGTPSSDSATQQSQPAQSSSAQQSSAQTPGDKNKDNKQGRTDTSTSGKVAGTSNDRLFYALPDFLTVENASNIKPLTAGQKFDVVTRGSFDYVQYPWYGFLSAISQAENSEPGYGQGWEGFGKRYGAAFADGTIENYFTGAILPSMLHQDPRYFQLGQGSIWHRTLYAMSRNLITRTDSGKSQFNYSEVVGGALSAAISTYSYHPKGTSPQSANFISSDRTLPNTAKVWGTQYGYDTLTLVVKEFWPDIRRMMDRRRDAHRAAATPQTQ